MLEGRETTITKIYTMTIGYNNWNYGMLYNAIKINSVFQSTGFWPVIFPVVQPHLNIFKDGGILSTALNPT